MYLNAPLRFLRTRAIAALTLSPGPTIGEASGACGPELALVRSLLGHGMFSSQPATGFEEGAENFHGIPLFQRWVNFLSLCACWLPSANTTDSTSAAFSEASLHSGPHRNPDIGSSSTQKPNTTSHRPTRPMAAHCPVRRSGNPFLALNSQYPSLETGPRLEDAPGESR